MWTKTVGFNFAEIEFLKSKATSATNDRTLCSCYSTGKKRGWTSNEERRDRYNLKRVKFPGQTIFAILNLNLIFLLHCRQSGKCLRSHRCLSADGEQKFVISFLFISFLGKIYMLKLDKAKVESHFSSREISNYLAG